MISFYILSKRFFLKLEGLSDARVASITKKTYDFALHFYIDWKSMSEGIDPLVTELFIRNRKLKIFLLFLSHNLILLYQKILG